MLSLILICIIVSQCQATRMELNDYLAFYKLIFYEDSHSDNQLAPATIETMLNEMAMMEKSTNFRNELRGHRINRYRSLMQKCYESNVVMNQDATVTDLLLQTFDFHSNDCTEEYFVLLNEICKTFKQKSLARVLQENRESQYLNCWHRLMEPAIGTSMMLGSRIRKPLDELSPLVYRNSSAIIMPPTKTESPLRIRTECIRIAKRIASYLTNTHKPDYQNDFKHLIELPCDSLLKKTSHLMKDIYGMLRFSGLEESFITNNDVIFLNRYMFCFRVISQLEFVSYNVKLYTSDGFNQVDLVTADLPFVLESGQQITSDFPIAQSSGPSSSRKRKHSDQSTQEESDGREGSEVVVKVEMGKGRGKSIQYLTHWSDGNITMESKDYLVKNWHNPWLKFFRARAHENRLRHLARKKEEASKNKYYDPTDSPVLSQDNSDETETDDNL